MKINLTNQPIRLFFTYVLFLLFFIVPSEKVYATHAAGADLTYRWISGNTYEVTASFYRDCAGVDAPSSISLNWSSASCGITGAAVPLSLISNIEITFPCSTATTRCSGGTSPGYRQYVYRGNVTLRSSSNPNIKCSDWVLSYRENARNNAITTIQNPGNLDIFVEATLNNLNFPSNNSPTFANYPVALVCQGQTFAYNHGITDVDGDSLSYELINALSAHNVSVPYINPYSGTNPIASSPAVALNSVTGDIVMNPTTIQVGVVAVRVKEYRNGVLIGSVIRDMQIVVINCASNLLPTATGINGTAKFSTAACPGSLITFNVSSNDGNALQIVTMTWNNAISGATFTTAGSPHPTGTFSWTPSAADARSQPYTFTVTVRDNNCPVNGLQTYSYSIFVPNIAATLSPTNVSCNGGSNGSVSVTPGGGTSPYKFSWSPSGGTNATATGLTAQTYTVIVTDSNGCSKSFSSALTQPSVLNSVLSSSTNILCNGGNNGQATVLASGGTMPYTYSWTNGATMQTASSLTAGTYTATVTDARGCIKPTVVEITQPAVLTGTINSVNNVTCKGNKNGSIDLSVSGGTSGYTYLWTPGGHTTQDISALDTGSYSVTITDANGCSMVKTATVTEPSSVVPLFGTVGTASDLTCYSDNSGSVTVNTSVLGGTPPYSYSWSNGLTTPSVSGLEAGSYTVVIKDGNGCTADTTFNIAQPDSVQGQFPTFSVYLGGFNTSCYGASNGSIDLSPSGGTLPYTYLWSNGSTTKDLSNIAAGSYTVTITDGRGCTGVNSASITEPDSLIAAVTGVNISCKGQANGKIFTDVTGGFPTYSFNWLPGTLPNDPDVIHLQPGFYSVTVTDANGCTAIDTVSITEPDTLVPLISQITFTNVNVTCFGSCNGKAWVDSVSGGTPGFSFLWNNILSGDTLDNLCVGENLLHVSDFNGCVFDTIITLIGPPELTITVFDSATISCHGLTNGFISPVSVVGGVGGYTYNWSPGNQTTASVSGLSAGQYCLTVTDLNSCQRTFCVDLTQPDTLDVTAASSAYGGFNISCNGSLTGSIDLSASGGTGNYVYLWSPGGETTSSVSNLAAGSYCVQVTDDNNCPFDTCFTLIQPDTISISDSLSVYAGGTNISCFGLFDGYASVNLSGGVSPYAVVWSTGDTSDSIRFAAAGTYTYNVTDSNGCQKGGLVVLTEPVRMQIAHDSSTSILCHGDTTGCIYITVTGGVTPYSYDWPNEILTEDQCNLAAGTYNVVVTDQNGCIRDSVFTLSEPAALSNSPAVSAYTGGFNIQCYGQSNGYIALHQAGGSPPYTYSWSGSANTTDSIGGLPPGTYSVHITDTNGCEADSSFILIEPPSFILNAMSSTPANCGVDNGTATVTVSGGIFPYSYAWSPAGGTLQTATGLASGSYTVTVTDSLGCTFSPSVNVGNTANLSASLQSFGNVSCNGGNNGTAAVTPAGGTLPYTYSWSPSGGTGSVAAGLTSGTYSVTVTDSTGCSYVVSGIDISQPSVLTASLASSNVSCIGVNSGTATVTVGGGTPGYSYSWSPSGGSNASASGLSPGAYFCTVTDSLGCSTVVSGIVITQSTLTASASSSSATCVGVDNGTVTITTGGGIPSFSYNWSPPVSSGASATGLSAGTYMVVVTDSSGCTAAVTSVVTQIPALTAATAQVNLLCNGDNSGSMTVTPSGGTSPFTYNWSPSVSADSAATGLSANTYTVIITDVNGCTTAAAGIVAEPLILTATANPTNVICNGQNNGSATAIAGGGTVPYTYNWFPSGGAGSTATGLAPGTYAVAITDANGCTSGALAVIAEPPPLTTSAGPDTVICGTSVQLSAVLANGQTGSWTGNSNVIFTNPANPNTNASDLIFGQNTLQWNITDVITGCQASDVVVVNSYQPVTASVRQTDTSLCLKDFIIGNGRFSLEALNPAPGTGVWTEAGTGTLSDTLALTTTYTAPADTGTHNIMWTVSNGPCIDAATVSLKIINDGPCLDLELPNGFSPNGDGKNDHYIIVGLEAYKVNVFKVFNRWGNEVFNKENYVNHTNDWQGENNNGEPLPTGTYYVILVTDQGRVVRNTFVDLRR